MSVIHIDYNKSYSAAKSLVYAADALKNFTSYNQLGSGMDFWNGSACDAFMSKKYDWCKETSDIRKEIRVICSGIVRITIEIAEAERRAAAAMGEPFTMPNAVLDLKKTLNLFEIFESWNKPYYVLGKKKSIMTQTDKMRELSAKLKQEQTRVHEASSHVRRGVSQLDWQVGNRQQINSRLEKIIARLKKQAHIIDLLLNAVSKTANEFENTDRKLKSECDKINYSLKQFIFFSQIIIRPIIVGPRPVFWFSPLRPIIFRIINIWRPIPLPAPRPSVLLDMLRLK